MLSPEKYAPIAETVAVELLADILRESAGSRPAGAAIYEYRRYAAVVIEALHRVSVSLVERPKVVRLRGERKSTKALRSAARRAWSKRLEETGDDVAAFGAAIRATLKAQPSWSVRDACRHTLEFIVPDDQREA